MTLQAIAGDPFGPSVIFSMEMDNNVDVQGRTLNQNGGSFMANFMNGETWYKGAGNSQCLTLTSLGSEFNLKGKDFTLEAQFYFTTTANTWLNFLVIDSGQSTRGSHSAEVHVSTDLNFVVFNTFNGTGTVYTVRINLKGNCAPLNTVLNYKLIRKGSLYSFYINEELYGYTVSNLDVMQFTPGSARLGICQYPNNIYANNFNGYINDYRLTTAARGPDMVYPLLSLVDVSLPKLKMLDLVEVPVSLNTSLAPQVPKGLNTYARLSTNEQLMGSLGTGTFNGYTFETENSPLVCDVSAVHSITKKVIATTVSDTSGKFTIPYLDENLSYDVLAKPVNGLYERKMVEGRTPQANTSFKCEVYAPNDISVLSGAVSIPCVPTIGGKKTTAVFSSNSGLTHDGTQLQGNFQPGTYSLTYSFTFTPPTGAPITVNKSLNLTVTANPARKLPLKTNTTDIYNGETWAVNDGNAAYYRDMFAARDGVSLSLSRTLNIYPSVNNGRGWVISFKFNLDTLTVGKYHTLLSTGETSFTSNNFYFMVFGDGAPSPRKVYISRGNLESLTGTVTIQPFRDYYVTVSCPPTSPSTTAPFYMYINGQLMASSASFNPSLPAMTQLLRLGINKWDSVTDAGFAGLIGDVVLMDTYDEKYNLLSSSDLYPHHEHSMTSIRDDRGLLWLFDSNFISPAGYTFKKKGGDLTYNLFATNPPTTNLTAVGSRTQSFSTSGNAITVTSSGTGDGYVDVTNFTPPSDYFAVKMSFSYTTTDASAMAGIAFTAGGVNKVVVLYREANQSYCAAYSVASGGAMTQLWKVPVTAKATNDIKITFDSTQATTTTYAFNEIVVRADNDQPTAADIFVCNSTATITAFKVFGGASAVMPAKFNQINEIAQFDTGDFTVAVDVIFNELYDCTLVDAKSNSTSWNIELVGGKLKFDTVTFNNFTPLVNTLYKLKFSRISNEVMLIVDDAFRGGGALTTNYSTISPQIILGGKNDAAYTMNGTLANFRIIKGYGEPFKTMG